MSSSAYADRKTINNPQVRGYSLDLCREFGTNCGKPAADAYCQSQGYRSSVNFMQVGGQQETRTIGSGQVCSRPEGCDRISQVVCTTVASARNLNVLGSGDRFEKGDVLSSPNGCFSLALQEDGNLVLYYTGTSDSAWSSRTAGRAVKFGGMNPDGIFILRGYNGEIIWRAPRNNNSAVPGSNFVLQNDGNIVIYPPGSKKSAWSSGSRTPCK